mmetsp:Transcript_49738/g.80277  ORF Transcript_49738/g.80277 Transcript_49738/m.80277 type:complete len:200 (-) Transcript_49738:15-614(-)
MTRHFASCITMLFSCFCGSSSIRINAMSKPPDTKLPVGGGLAEFSTYVATAGKASPPTDPLTSAFPPAAPPDVCCFLFGCSSSMTLCKDIFQPVQRFELPMVHFPHLPHLASLFWFGLGGLVRQKVVRGAVFVTNDNAPMLLDVRRKDGDAHRTQVHRRYKEALLAQERLFAGAHARENVDCSGEEVKGWHDLHALETL